MQIENLIGALNYLYLINDLENYREKIKNIDLPEGFLKLKINNNLYIFDDSYNANPKGVFESLKFFKELYFDYKVIIFNGLLELGKETKNIYQDLAEEFSVFNKIILTSSDFIEIFQEVSKDKFLLIKNSKELEIFLQSLKFEKVGIWIFNRFPERIMLKFN
jgi:UDP-N-acetylmuramyl pentapeptide synthase